MLDTYRIQILTGIWMLTMCCLAPGMLPASAPAGELPEDAPIEINLGPEAAEYGEHLSIKLLTLGQGDPLYLWFGHTALIVEDHRRQISRLYDFGVFNFEQENFFTNFAMGRLIYGVMASPTERRMQIARYNQRNIRITELNLPPEKRLLVAAYLEEKVKPGNNTYLYHHYDDNCATRIRDIIDLAVDGQFREWAENIDDGMTFREHTRRHTHQNFFLDWILNFLQGGRIDLPISRWEGMFLPGVLETSVQEFSYREQPDDPESSFQPLAAAHQVITDFPGRDKILETWQPHWPKGFVFGSAAAVILFFPVFMIKRTRLRLQLNRTYRYIRLHGILQAVTGLFLGLLGSVLFFMMFFTNHDVTFGNQNLFFVNPGYLAVLVFGIRAAVRPEQSEKPVRRITAIWRAETLLFLVMLIVKLFPGQYQWNMLTISLVLPVLLTQSRCWEIDRLSKTSKISKKRNSRRLQDTTQRN